MKIFNFLAIMFVLAGATIFSGCRTVPVSERKQLNFISDAQMASAVNEEFSAVKKNAANDTEKQNTLLRVGARIVEQARKEDKSLPEFSQWEFVVVKDDTANAFAMPGGKVAFNTGIFPLFANDDELAVVMSHEVSHVIARHGGERATQQVLAQGGTMFADILAQKVTNDTLRQVIPSAYGFGAQMTLLKYSRTHESEADAIGLRIMARAGYNPNAAVSFWQRMAANSQGGTLEVLSTHPSDATRIADLQKLIPEVMPDYEKTKK